MLWWSLAVAAVCLAGVLWLAVEIVVRARGSGIWEHLFEVGRLEGGPLQVRQPFAGPDPVQLVLGESGEEARPAAWSRRVAPKRGRLVPRAGSADLIVVGRSIDGLAAAGVVLRHLGDAEVIYGETASLIRLLGERAPGPGHPPVDRVIVIDLAIPLAVSEGQLVALSHLMQRFAREKVEVFWYDRHMWNDEAFNLVRESVAELVVDEDASTTRLVRRALGGAEGDFGERCVGLVERVGDERDRVWRETWGPFLVAASEAHVAPEVRTAILTRFAREEAPRPNEVALLEQMNRGERIETRFASFVRPWIIEGPYRSLAVIDGRRLHLEFDDEGTPLYALMVRRLTRRAAFRVASQVGADLMIFIETNRRYLVQRCGESRVQLTALFALDELAGTPVSVRGHNEACDVVVRSWASLSRRVLWDLTDEAKSLIRHVEAEFV